MDFAHLYKSAAETNVKLITSDEKSGKTKRKKMKPNLVTPNTEETVGEDNMNENQPLNNISNKKARKKDKVKSAQVTKSPEIVKNSVVGEMKPKKRNKSVSFMLDDKEEVAVKKTKSDIAANNKQSTTNDENNARKRKNNKKTQETVVNNDAEINKRDMVSDSNENTNTLKRNISTKVDTEENEQTKKKKKKKSTKIMKVKESGDSNTNNENLINKNHDSIDNKKKKKHKETETEVDTSTMDKVTSVENKKSKKKKQLTKKQNDENKIDPDKTINNDNKPEIIAENLENLSIGDNTHTLSNLLDEMTVVDKKKQKKRKIKKKDDKKLAAEAEDHTDGSKEREKWQKKRWNKGKKGKDDPDKGLHPVNVENLPISIILTYKKLLAERFAQCGTVRRVGIAQIYPADSTKPVFNTTVYFDTAADATKALDEDNTSFEGSTIRVLRPHPATETTAVVRTFGPLTEQIISTIFSNVGRIRRIRHLVKGKKSMATAFVELDEPEAVERAIKMAEEVKVGGKKVHVSKFQLHEKPKKDKKKHNTTAKEEEKKPEVNDEDSDDSTD